MEYQHGGDIYSQEILWDFSANINPLGPPEGVKEAVRRSADSCGHYPDSQCRRLVGELARHHQLPKQEILCGNGAADLIFQMVFAERPGHAWLMAPTFSEYGQALHAVGTQIHPILLRKEAGFRLDADGVIDAVQDEMRNPSFLFLCNPNNPTGVALRRGEMRKLAAFAQQKGIRMIVDECFLDFLEEPKEYSMIPDLQEFPHLVILKAFTKLYGMAGLRLGYCLTADKDLLERMEQVRQPWSVSSVAQEAGQAALGENEYLEKTGKIIREGRAQLKDGLKDLGFWVCDSQANYIFFQDTRAGAQDGRLGKACRERKLLLRSCGNYQGLDQSFYRVCVKTKEENEHLLQMLRECCR
ncbi:MAG: histidinol-phosphate transaminase [Lachnospiraceae bacterium]|nr:histidinol-phosphate transaminase [Lachnospiraceae bacterium]